MKKIPRISETEWEVMKVVGGRRPVPPADDRGPESPDAAWHPKGRSFQNRLVKKKAIGFNWKGGRISHHPLARQSECPQAASRCLEGSGVFGDYLQPTLAQFVARKRLSQETPLIEKAAGEPGVKKPLQNLSNSGPALVDEVFLAAAVMICWCWRRNALWAGAGTRRWRHALWWLVVARLALPVTIPSRVSLSMSCRFRRSRAAGGRPDGPQPWTISRRRSNSRQSRRRAAHWRRDLAVAVAVVRGRPARF